MLELVGVVWTDGVTERLSRLSLSTRPGEILGLIGPTGGGKSSALAVMAGAVVPTRGRLVWEGTDISRKPARLHAHTGLTTHELPGPTDVTVDEWLSLFASLDEVSAERLGGRQNVLSALGIEGLLERKVSTLSRGERRRMALARVSLRRPRLFLLDGPADGLDGLGLRQVTACVKEAASSGSTVVLTAVAPHLPTSLCDRVLVISGGAVVAEHLRTAPQFAASVAGALGWGS